MAAAQTCKSGKFWYYIPNIPRFFGNIIPESSTFAYLLINMFNFPYNTEPREPAISIVGVKGAQCLPLVPIREACSVEKDGVG